jgi:hypothetical protein
MIEVDRDFPRFTRFGRAGVRMAIPREIIKIHCRFGPRIGNFLSFGSNERLAVFSEVGDGGFGLFRHGSF